MGRSLTLGVLIKGFEGRDVGLLEDVFGAEPAAESGFDLAVYMTAQRGMIVNDQVLPGVGVAGRGSLDLFGSLVLVHHIT